MIRLRKLLLASLVCVCFFELGCNDSSDPTTPANSDPQNMIGNWKVDQITKDGKNQSYNDTSMIIEITSSEMTTLVNMKLCYFSYAVPITISGNSVSMDGENGTVTVSGDKMTVTSPTRGTITMSKFSGQVPPGNWPKKVCDSTMFNGGLLP
jgi:hypothetical protein